MMSKKQDDLMAMAMSLTTENIVKGRGASGRKTYLDRFVTCLLDENGQPTEPKKRTTIIAEVSLEIALEKRADEIEQGVEDVVAFDLNNEDDKAIFKGLNNKVKNQIAAAVSDSQNSTALSYNEKYKDVWTVVKEAGMVSLAAKA